MLNESDEQQSAQAELQIHNLKLSDLVDAYLGIELDDKGVIIPRGHKFESMPCPKHVADKIFALTLNRRNPANVFVEYPDEFNGFMRQPKVWDWNLYQEDYSKRVKDKAISHASRVERYLLEENVHIVSRAAIDVLGMDVKRAKGYAFQLLKKTNAKTLIHITLGEDVQILESEEDLANYKR